METCRDRMNRMSIGFITDDSTANKASLRGTVYRGEVDEGDKRIVRHIAAACDVPLLFLYNDDDDDNYDGRRLGGKPRH